MTAAAIIETVHLSKEYPIRVTIGERIRGHRPILKAVDEVSISIEQGETLALVGMSGSGKSTLGRLIVRLEEPTDGRIILEGQDITQWSGRRLRGTKRRVQIIFQNPYESLDPRYRVAKCVCEPLDLFRIGDKSERRDRTGQALADVGLEPVSRYLASYPHELSGGQRQRVAVARALVLEPTLIVADEPVSMLDASIQSGVMNMLRDLQAERGLSYLFITHDLAAARYMSQRVAVMHQGRVVETGRIDALVASCESAYTRQLIDAASATDPGSIRNPRSIRNGKDGAKWRKTNSTL